MNWQKINKESSLCFSVVEIVLIAAVGQQCNFLALVVKPHKNKAVFGLN